VPRTPHLRWPEYIACQVRNETYTAVVSREPSSRYKATIRTMAHRELR